MGLGLGARLWLGLGLALGYWPGYDYYYPYYPYGYSFGPGWAPYDPYYDPYDPPDDPPPARRYRDDPNSNQQPDSNSQPSVTPNPNDPNRPPAPRSTGSPLKNSNAPLSSPDRPPSANPVITAAAYRPTALLDGAETITTDSGNRLDLSSARPRPEVLKAMRALREMPPFAREREIDFGRYSNFSFAERELLRNMDQWPTP